ncbi:hypothetical protein [Acidaminococcus intestini]|uniref:hypothetical protein n=1 Tax=Acidaminococcus intestini TaxID=187327 RepID=UPI00047D5A70|nr:hypothetical protein [Acidaminococcus intestini]
MEQYIPDEIWVKALEHVDALPALISEYKDATIVLSLADYGDEDHAHPLVAKGSYSQMFAHLITVVDSLIEDMPRERAMRFLLNLTVSLASVAFDLSKSTKK